MPRLRQAGFSLLEMLVTLIVIVLITSLVSLAINSGGQEIQLEAKVRNLGEVAAYAVDEAQLIGRDYGLLLQQEVVEGSVREHDPEIRIAGGEGGTQQIVMRDA